MELKQTQIATLPQVPIISNLSNHTPAVNRQLIWKLKLLNDDFFKPNAGGKPSTKLVETEYGNPIWRHRTGDMSAQGDVANDRN